MLSSSEAFGSKVGSKATTRAHLSQMLKQGHAGSALILQQTRRQIPTANPHSGPATFLASTSPVDGSRISSQLTASSGSPVLVETANNTPSELAAVERKSADTRERGQSIQDGRQTREVDPHDRESPSEICAAHHDVSEEHKKEQDCPQRTTLARTTSPGRKHDQICREPSEWISSRTNHSLNRVQPDLDRVLCSLSHVLTPDDPGEIRSARSPVDGQERQRRRLPGDARDRPDHLRPTGR